MSLLLYGMNHRTAPVEIRERLSLNNEEIKKLVDFIKKRNQNVKGAVVLSTCNRLEIYISYEAGLKDELLNLLHNYFKQKTSLADRDIKDKSYVLYEYEAMKHLFFVAAGLDSMIVGETEILGQVKEAYIFAGEEDMTDVYLNGLFQQAIGAGKYVREKTGIDKKAVSVSYAAVEKAKKIFGNISDRNVFILGAGKMSVRVARYLVDNGVSTVFVSNRSFDKARELAAEVGGKAIKFDEFDRYIKLADIVICCTGAPHFVLRYEFMSRILAYKDIDKMMLIDIAVPRDVEPSVSQINNISLYDIDDLENVAFKNLEERRKLVEEGYSLIEEKLEEFINWLQQREAVPTIAALKEKIENISRAEVKRALNRMQPDRERDKEIIETMAGSIVNKILHDPVTRLKSLPVDRIKEYRSVIDELFNLEENKNSSRD